MLEDDRPKRIRFRLGTLLFVVAILALLLVVVIQQVQMGRMRQRIGQMNRTIDAEMKTREKLVTIIRELRDKVSRQQ